MNGYVWQPGVGIDAAALARLRSHFKRPAEPMGEAWFMGDERRMFHELEGPLEHLTVRQLQDPLEAIGSGTNSFGPFEEWHDWYHYLLSHLIPRSHEEFAGHSLQELLITAFMALYPNGLGRPPYPEFASDVLATLGRCMMAPECWDRGEIVVGAFLHRANCWWNASGDFSASLYFCLKYLPPALVHGWFTSLLEIESPHWQAQVIVWLVGSDEMFRGQWRWPSEFAIKHRPDVGWDWSHVLGPGLAEKDESGLPVVMSLVPERSRQEVLAAVRAYFTEEKFLGWLESIARVPDLEAALTSIPSTFERLYVDRPPA